MRVLTLIAFLFWLVAFDTWAEVEFECVLSEEQDVPIVKTTAITTPAMVQHGLGDDVRILINETLLNDYSPLMQEFIVKHECAHILLGHVGMNTLAQERQADCLTMKKMIKNEEISTRGVKSIINFLYRESVVNRQRAIALGRCLQ